MAGQANCCRAELGLGLTYALVVLTDRHMWCQVIPSLVLALCLKAVVCGCIFILLQEVLLLPAYFFELEMCWLATRMCPCDRHLQAVCMATGASLQTNSGEDT
jgi:hypothetical protein